MFESADAPHVVKGTGAVYVRTAEGKEPVEDQGALLALARRGRDALADAQERLWTSDLIRSVVGAPDADSFVPKPDELLVIVRASPLTVSPAFNDLGGIGDARTRTTPELRGITRVPRSNYAFKALSERG